MKTFRERNPGIAILLAGILPAIIFRYLSLPFENRDLWIHNLVWYQAFIDMGIPDALAQGVSNYSPPYTYLLALATLTYNFLEPIAAIKLIPIIFDFICSVFIYKIVKIKYPVGRLPYFASAGYLIAPTVIINSSFWGQADSIYTTFIIISLYYLLIDRPMPAMLAFGAAFAFKAQAVFFFPFLIVMALKRRIHWTYFVLLPIVYLVAILPAVILGRPLMEALFIYLSQANTYNRLSMKAPNLYTFMPETWYEPGVIIGLIIAVIILIFWIRFSARSELLSTSRGLVFAALVSVALTPFLLPKMHDRYFYPADVVSIVAAFYWPAAWFLPFLYQAISLLAYTNFFYNATLPTIFVAAALNLITISWMLRIQIKFGNPSGLNPILTTGLSWVSAVLVPAILLGIGIRLLLTPVFLKVEYNLPGFPVDVYGFTTRERLQWAPYAQNYLLNKKEIKFLNRLRFEEGMQVFNDRERLHMTEFKGLTESILNPWYLSLIALPVLGFFAWITGWLPLFQQGLRRGGWLSIGLAILMFLFVIPVFRQFYDLVNNLFFNEASWIFTSRDSLTRLFPLRFWRDCFLVISTIILAGGAAIALGSSFIYKSKLPHTLKANPRRSQIGSEG